MVCIEENVEPPLSLKLVRPGVRPKSKSIGDKAPPLSPLSPSSSTAFFARRLGVVTGLFARLGVLAFRDDIPNSLRISEGRKSKAASK
jgi:hypothetical protein